MTRPAGTLADATGVRDPSSERAQAFIYGTITTLVAMAGLELVGAPSTGAVAAIVVASAVATWLAHSYATLIGRGLIAPGATAGSNLRAVAGTWWSAMHASAPILYAALPALAAFALAALGVWSLTTAIWVGNLAGIAIMGVTSVAAARAHHATLLAQVLSVVVTTLLGLVIVAVEYAVHHD
jgi:hypothetical protein